MSGAGKRVMKTMTITMPVSEEAFGHWLEENHVKVEVSCSLGNYNVRLNAHTMESYKEVSDVSVRRSRDVEVSVYGKSFNTALTTAMNSMALALAQVKP